MTLFEISTARVVAPTAFAINFAAQVYGMLSTPNMKEIADNNHYAFSPNPIFIGAFFAPQMVLQLAWIRKLFNGEVNSDDAQLQYLPIYALGNICIAGWMFFWNAENFWASQALVTINTLAHIYAVSQLPPIVYGNRLTHLVAKTTAGIGILDFLDNGAVALRYEAPPSRLVNALTGLTFAIASGLSDWIVGGCVIYDLVALTAGQHGPWRTSLGLFTAGSATLVAIRNVFFRRGIRL